MVISQKEAAREVRLTIPNAYSRDIPRIEVHKVRGDLEEEDLTLCAQIMAHANVLSATRPPPQQQQHTLPGVGGFGPGWQADDPFSGGLFKCVPQS